MIVQLKTPLLGNTAGAIGVCYDTYSIGDRPGCSFIFENGDHDGFSLYEMDEFLETIRKERMAGFQYIPKFENVMKLAQQYADGDFESYFELGRDERLIRPSFHLEDEVCINE